MAVRLGQVFQLLLQVVVQIFVWIVLRSVRGQEKQLDFVVMRRHPLAHLDRAMHPQVVNNQKDLARRIFDEPA